MEAVARDRGAHDVLKVDHARAARKDIVVRDQQTAKILCVDRIAAITGAHKVIRDFGSLPRTAQLNAVAALRNEIVVDGQSIGIVDDQAVLKVDEAHVRDAEGVLCTSDVDTRLAVEIRVLRDILARTIVHEMETVNAEAHEFNRADTRVALALDHEGSTSRLIVRISLQIDKDAAAARPELVHIFPILLGDVETDARRHEAVA